MIGKEIVAQKPVSLVSVKEILKERSSAAEMSYEQKTTYDYARKFAKLTKAKEAKLLEELKSNESIEDKFAIKIVDIMPDNFEVMKVIAHKNSKASEEDLAKAFEIVKKYLK